MAESKHTPGDSKNKLFAAAGAISSAVLLLKMEMPTIEAFLKECRDMDNVGAVIDPTLFRDPERRAVEAVVKPLFEAAKRFVATHDQQMEKSKEALAKVSGAA